MFTLFNYFLFLSICKWNIVICDLGFPYKNFLWGRGSKFYFVTLLREQCNGGSGGDGGRVSVCLWRKKLKCFFGKKHHMMHFIMLVVYSYQFNLKKPFFADFEKFHHPVTGFFLFEAFSTLKSKDIKSSPLLPLMQHISKQRKVLLVQYKVKKIIEKACRSSSNG